MDLIFGTYIWKHGPAQLCEAAGGVGEETYQDRAGPSQPLWAHVKERKNTWRCVGLCLKRLPPPHGTDSWLKTVMCVCALLTHAALQSKEKRKEKTSHSPDVKFQSFGKKVERQTQEMRKENSWFRVASTHQAVDLYSENNKKENQETSEVYWAASFLMLMINLLL